MALTVSALTDDESRIFNRLRAVLEQTRPQTAKLNNYYHGIQLLEQLGLAIPDELKRFTVCVNWPRVVVDSVEQRLDVTGFRMPGTQTADAGLWDAWQYNNMDERSGFAHTDALALKRSYIAVSTNPEDAEYPLITVESPNEVVALRDPRTHRITAALRMYDRSLGGVGDRRATLYLPARTLWLVQDNGRWVFDLAPDDHQLGTVPVVALVNRNGATAAPGAVAEGVSEMHDVIPLADSASRGLTNAQLAQETVSAPQKYALGVAKGDFVDKNGDPLPVWAAYFGSVWASANADAKVGQLPSADLSNFETMVNVYAHQASSVSALPVEYFGLTTVNPPSADGQRAGETRLIKKAERKQSPFGNSWESVQRLVLRFRDGEWDPNARRMETLWRDAGTPTVAQVTDAIVKKFQVGLIDWETAQEQLGNSPETIDRMRERRNADSAAALGFGVQQAAESL